MDMYSIFIRNTRTNTPVMEVTDFNGIEVARNTAMVELARLGDRYRASGVFTKDADLVLAKDYDTVIVTAPLS